MSSTARSRPRRFLLVAHDAGGTVPPMLAVAQALIAHGHAVIVLGQPSMQARSVEAGCQFVAFTDLASYDQGLPLEQQLELVLTVMTGSGPGEDVLRIAAESKVDALFVDCNVAGALAAAEHLGALSAVLLHSLYRTYVDVWFGPMWPVFEPAINATRNTWDLEPVTSWTAMFEGHDRIYSAVPREFDAPTSLAPAAMRHPGFLVPLPPADAAIDAAALWSGFDGAKAHKVLVGLSTTEMGQGPILASIVEALGAMDVSAVITTSGQACARDIGLPDNVTAVDYLPHPLVMPEVDAVITHGGLGTVAGALSHGVPLVCTPIGRDQPLNAEQVASAGAGETVPAGKANAKAIRAALQRVLIEGRYRDNARHLAEASADAGGATTVAADLESLLPI